MDVPEVLIVIGILGLFGEILYNWRRNHTNSHKVRH